MTCAGKKKKVIILQLKLLSKYSCNNIKTMKYTNIISTKLLFFYKILLYYFFRQIILLFYLILLIFIFRCTCAWARISWSIAMSTWLSWFGTTSQVSFSLVFRWQRVKWASVCLWGILVCLLFSRTLYILHLQHLWCNFHTTQHRCLRLTTHSSSPDISSTNLLWKKQVVRECENLILITMSVVIAIVIIVIVGFTLVILTSSPTSSITYHFTTSQFAYSAIKLFTSTNGKFMLEICSVVHVGGELYQ